jgi:hypothetical protein
MSLERLAQELEKYASLKGVDIYVDESALKNSFVPIINEDGVVGAIGEYIEKNKTGSVVAFYNVLVKVSKEIIREKHSPRRTIIFLSALLHWQSIFSDSIK